MLNGFLVESLIQFWVRAPQILGAHLIGVFTFQGPLKVMYASIWSISVLNF